MGNSATQCFLIGFQILENFGSIFWNYTVGLLSVIVVGTDLVEGYCAARAGHKGIKAARAQYDAWRAIAETAKWTTPEEVKKSHPKASILKGSRVVFNIKGNDYRLISAVDYRSGIVMIRFFGSHQEHDEVDAGTV